LGPRCFGQRTGVRPVHPGREGRSYDLSGQAGPLVEILRILKDHNISANQMVEVRSNPMLCQQIQAIGGGPPEEL
jgi:hypothetical protein